MREEEIEVRDGAAEAAARLRHDEVDGVEASPALKAASEALASSGGCVVCVAARAAKAHRATSPDRRDLKARNKGFDLDRVAQPVEVIAGDAFHDLCSSHRRLRSRSVPFHLYRGERGTTLTSPPALGHAFDGSLALEVGEGGPQPFVLHREPFA